MQLAQEHNALEIVAALQPNIIHHVDEESLHNLEGQLHVLMKEVARDFVRHKALVLSS